MNDDRMTLWDWIDAALVVAGIVIACYFVGAFVA